MQQGYGSQDDTVSVALAIVENIAALVRSSSNSLGSRLASTLPTVTTDVTLYKAPRAITTSGLFITNTSASTVKVRVHHVGPGEQATVANALYYDQDVAAGATVQAFPNGGIDLQPNESLVVRTATGTTLAFNLYGGIK